MTDTATDKPFSGVTVSVKPHGGYDAPMLIFKGEDSAIVQQNVAAFFGLTEEYATPFETFVAGHEIAKALYSVHELLGASPEPSKGKGYTNYRKGSASVSGASTGAPSTPAAPAHPFQLVLDKIAAAPDKGELVKIWALNQTGEMNVNGGWPHADLDAAAAAQRAKWAEAAK